MVILITIHCLAHGIYTEWYLNVLEIAFLLDLILLGYVATASTSDQLTFTSVLLVVSFLLFFGIIIYHIHLRVKPKVDIETYCKKAMRAKMFVKHAFSTDDSLGSDSGSSQQNDQYRERLLDSSFHRFIDDN